MLCRSCWGTYSSAGILSTLVLQSTSVSAGESDTIQENGRVRQKGSSRREFLGTVGRAVALPIVAGTSLQGLSRLAQAAVAPLRQDEIFYKSATKMAKMVRKKRISSRELIQAHLDRINQVNPKINAIIELVADKALARADAADQVLARGENWGPLHGVPVTIKDAFETAGIRTTCGTMGLKDNIPKQNATAVQRLLDAGAIILGKTNTPELTMAYETDNLTDGRSLNPYALDRSPGGSSGGEAAAIASGCSPLGLGNDCGGSIRVPSHFTGVAGLCPTWGRVPISGLVGRIFGGSFQTAFNVVAGPMARFVEDLALALPILSGPDARDPFSYPFPLSNFKRVDLKKLRIAFYADNGFSKPHPAVSRPSKRLPNR